MAFLGYHVGLTPEEFGRLPHKLTRAYKRHVIAAWLDDVKLRAKIAGG